MQQLSYSIILGLCLATCNFSQKNPYESTERVAVAKPIVEQFDTVIQHSSLTVKRIDDKIYLKYKKRGQNSVSIKLPFYHNSELAFPSSSVVGFSKGATNLNLGRCFFYQDSVLVLPLLGVNNTLSSYIVNLQSGKIILDDVRTSFFWIWIDSGDGSLYLASTLNPHDDSLYKFTMKKAIIRHDSLLFVEQKEFAAPFSVTEDLVAQRSLLW